ncbi:MAG: ribosomal protein S18-alanine N-acetyltransferase [Thermomicrobiales bacterium]|nr:ribosomal protein S18-alanine N-acetyltransferase [Thermomicrobiales bacterium]MCO5221099.1 ribosomal protein S18-alanine N-acetyltransferase [Thermomicrobiales bacterium]
MTGTLFSIEPMQLEDIPEVSRVERRCFSNPWPAAAYRRELRNLEQNYYIVLRGSDASTLKSRDKFVSDYAESWRGIRALGLRALARRSHQAADTEPIAGFAGMWHLFDEAHVTTIGVDNPYRGRGLGEALLLRLIDEAVRRGANVVTLEVRISNEHAIRLYEKYGFSIHGVRPHYYSDNGEDAYLMWSPALRDERYLTVLDEHRHALIERLQGVLDLPRQGPIWASRRIDDRNAS